jgi:hypothetical protein
MAVALAPSTMASAPLEVDLQTRHDWMSALTMHDDEIARLSAGRGRAAQGGDSRSPPVDVLEGHRNRYAGSSATIEEEPLARIAALPELEHWLEQDTIPIPATSDGEYYYDDRHFEYWLSGIDDIQAACPEVPWTGARLLDFGGATGRVSRHFYLQGNLSAVTLCDGNINNVAWVLEHYLFRASTSTSSSRSPCSRR